MSALLSIFSTTLIANEIVQQPTFAGIIKLNDGTVSSGDHLSIVYRKPQQPYGTKEFEFKVTPNTDGSFEFQLPRFKDPLELRIYLRSPGKRSTQIGSAFFVETNDSIFIQMIKTKDLDVGAVFYSGHGVEKYIIANKLEKLCSSDLGTGEFREGLVRIKLLNPENFESKITQYDRLADSLLNKKHALIRNSGLSDKIKRMLSYNSAPIYFDWFRFLSAIYSGTYKNNPQIRALIKLSVEKNRSKFKYKSDTLMKFCPLYLWQLANEEYRSLLLYNEQKDVSYQMLYDVFKTRYVGPIRESLIANLFGFGLGWGGKEPLSPSMLDSIAKDGLKYIETPIIKQAYHNQMKQNKGADVFNGKFRDLAGKEISIASLKGKVVFLDFWFTGCGACAKFHQDFHKEGYPQLKSNKDFVYLSVCLDKQKEKWIKGIKSGEYSSEDYLNVHADLGTADPFIKYYERATFPFIILMDKKGKVYAANPIPNPQAVVDLINNALNAR